MTNRLDRRWMFWQAATPASRAASRPQIIWGGRLAGYNLTTPNDTVIDFPTPANDPLADLKAEVPGPDGIRTKLVERVRQLIAQGAYDTPERWTIAEQHLFHRFAEQE